MPLGLHNKQYRSSRGSTICQPLRAERVGLRGGRYRSFSWAERLAARTVKGPSCWNVTGCKVGPNGYGQIGGTVDGRQERKYAHRLAWELANNRPVPDGLVVMHSCDNPRCVNPSHLSVGTQSQNIHDSIRKGRFKPFGYPSRIEQPFNALNNVERVRTIELDIRGEVA